MTKASPEYVKVRKLFCRRGKTRGDDVVKACEACTFFLAHFELSLPCRTRFCWTNKKIAIRFHSPSTDALSLANHVVNE